jgi:hypothetical protein
MAKRKPIPKTQKEISTSQHIPYDKESGNPNLATNSKDRGNKHSFRGDDTKPLKIGIQDIDEAVFYYFDKVIQPSVYQNSERIPVPIIYGAPEKWKSYQKDGYYRDTKGKIMAPLIMIKRTNLEKNRTIANKLDANNPNNFNVFTKTYDKRNAYDQFAVLNNRIPIKQFYASVVPDYITLTYECVVFTYYVEQLNKVVESIQYASDAYWGDPERFKFNARIDSFAFETQMQTDNERVVRSSFSIKLNGYVVPEILQRDLNGIEKYTEKAKIIFSMETDTPPGFYEGTQVGDRIETDKLPDPNRKDRK